MAFRSTWSETCFRQDLFLLYLFSRRQFQACIFCQCRVWVLFKVSHKPILHDTAASNQNGLMQTGTAIIQSIMARYCTLHNNGKYRTYTSCPAIIRFMISYYTQHGNKKENSTDLNVTKTLSTSPSRMSSRVPIFSIVDIFERVIMGLHLANTSYQWVNARKTQLQCVSNGVTSFLH